MNKDNANTIAYVKFKGDDDFIYESTGVLMEDSSSQIRIAFNAYNDVVEDDITIQKTQIVEFKVLEEENLMVLSI